VQIAFVTALSVAMEWKISLQIAQQHLLVRII
jgi:hypothetical protein